MNKSEPAATAGGLGALLLWSTTIAVIRSLSERVGPIGAAAWVYSLGGLLCLARYAWSSDGWRQLRTLPRKYLFGCGGLFISYSVLLYLAVGLAKDREQALEIGLVNYLWPASTLLLSVVLLKKRATSLLIPGTILATGGVVLVMTQGGGVSWLSFSSHFRANPVAYLLGLAAAIDWALYSNLTRLWSPPGGASAVGLFIAFSGLILQVMNWYSTASPSWTLGAVAEVVFMGSVTALAYVLWEVAMRKGNLLLVAACSYITPFMSTLISCAYLKVTPGPRLWAGCAMIVVGSVTSWRSVSD